jgi:hypothetical protein
MSNLNLKTFIYHKYGVIMLVCTRILSKGTIINTPTFNKLPKMCGGHMQVGLKPNNTYINLNKCQIQIQKP